MKSSRSEWIAIRGLRYHVRHWGSDNAPVIFMLHGWMDVSATFQFLVDALARDWHVIAPDWRGFGLSAAAPSTYWFPDYLADLDFLLDHYSPRQPVCLLGHSLGANVAALYAGVRAQRVEKLILLEGFGLPVTAAEQAPARYATWLDQLHTRPVLRTYASVADVVERLQRNNPRLGFVQAEFLASHWAQENAEGRWEILADAAHRLSNPYQYRVDEVMACWSAISAAVLWVEAHDSALIPRLGGAGGMVAARAEVDRRIAFIKNVNRLKVADAGHMLQHDQPKIVAVAIEQFLE